MLLKFQTSVLFKYVVEAITSGYYLPKQKDINDNIVFIILILLLHGYKTIWTMDTNIRLKIWKVDTC